MRLRLGWKLTIPLDRYMLYTFGRLTSILCPTEFKRRATWFMRDLRKRGLRELKARCYVDYLFLLASPMWGLLVLITVCAYSAYLLKHGFRLSDVFYTWRVKFYGATKPLWSR